jgi:hypothetical protein
MIVKAINDTVELNELMLILLIFEVYSRMHIMNHRSYRLINKQ